VRSNWRTDSGSAGAAGVDRLVLYDGGIIKPGVLVRQPYDDHDIGFAKAKTLKLRLLRIRPSLNVEARIGTSIV